VCRVDADGRGDVGHVAGEIVDAVDQPPVTRLPEATHVECVDVVPLVQALQNYVPVSRRTHVPVQEDDRRPVTGTLPVGQRVPVPHGHPVESDSLLTHRFSRQRAIANIFLRLLRRRDNA